VTVKGRQVVPEETQVALPWEQTVAKLRHTGPMPRHVAIIMDGNGRWAHRRGLPRIAGHRASVAAIRDVVEASVELGLEVLTLYAFSTENWKRPPEEIHALMALLIEFVNREIAALHQHNVRVQAIGRVDQLEPAAAAAVARAEAITRDNDGLRLVLALNYGGRHEMVEAARALAADVAAGLIKVEDINVDLLARYLYTKDLPDPDLIIRTGGEMRLSNFLLWQGAYAEFWHTDVWWPDFRRQHLAAAITSYQGRERRFGALGSGSPGGAAAPC